MMMIDFCISVLLVALLSAFVNIVFKKWEIMQWIQVHGNNFFSKMASCDFCFGFWVGLLLSIGAATITGNVYLLFVPVFSAPITRFIL